MVNKTLSDEIRKKLSQTGLEKLIKDNFCNMKGIVGCDYILKPYCPRTCNYAKSLEVHTKQKYDSADFSTDCVEKSN